MQYQVICNKCGKNFFIDGESGKEVHCTCPYCAQQLLVSLPIVAQPFHTPAQPEQIPLQRPIRQKQSSGTGLKLLIALLLVLIIGGGAFYAFTQWRNMQEVARQELAAQRKAHQDSLMRIRAQEEAAQAAEEQKQEQQQRVCRFLADFYQKAIIPYGDPTYYDKYLTGYCRQLVASETQYNEGDAWQMWWALFGMMNQSPNEAELIRNLTVTPISDNWYRVRLSQGGKTEFRQIKVVIDHGQVMIDDVK